MSWPTWRRAISPGTRPCKRPRFCCGSIRWHGGSVPLTGPRAMRCAMPLPRPILGDAAAYCRTLAQVALEGAASFPALGLAMARTCDVRRRIAAIQRRVSAAALGRRAVFGVILAGLLASALLAGRVCAGRNRRPGKPGPVGNIAGEGGRQEPAGHKPAKLLDRIDARRGVRPPLRPRSSVRCWSACSSGAWSSRTTSTTNWTSSDEMV